METDDQDETITTTIYNIRQSLINLTADGIIRYLNRELYMFVNS